MIPSGHPKGRTRCLVGLCATGLTSPALYGSSISLKKYLLYSSSSLLHSFTAPLFLSKNISSTPLIPWPIAHYSASLPRACFTLPREGPTPSTQSIDLMVQLRCSRRAQCVLLLLVRVHAALVAGACPLPSCSPGMLMASRRWCSPSKFSPAQCATPLAHRWAPCTADLCTGVELHNNELHSSKQQGDIALKAHVESVCFKYLRCFRCMLQSV
jgi:hypothetical protein